VGTGYLSAPGLRVFLNVKANGTLEACRSAGNERAYLHTFCLRNCGASLLRASARVRAARIRSRKQCLHASEHVRDARFHLGVEGQTPGGGGHGRVARKSLQAHGKARVMEQRSARRGL